MALFSRKSVFKVLDAGVKLHGVELPMHLDQIAQISADSSATCRNTMVAPRPK